MTELEAGLDYCYDDEEVELRKENAIEQCKKYNSIDDKDYAAQYSQLQKNAWKRWRKSLDCKNFQL